MGPTRVLRGSHSAVEQRAFGGAARRSGDFIRAREGAAACALLDTGETPPTATRVEPGMRMCMRPQASRDYFKSHPCHSAGEALLYDARLLHGGGANVCGAPPEAGAGAELGTRAAVASAAAGVRVLFYATFKRQGGQQQ
jgi:ectoine hydroxylase-related dioxygenase (phytanoyl-CoA dioxygenase family)